MIQIKLMLMGVSVLAAIGFAVYNHYKNQEQPHQHSYGSQRRRRTSSPSGNANNNASSSQTSSSYGSQRSSRTSSPGGNADNNSLSSQTGISNSSGSGRTKRRYNVRKIEECTICLVKVVKDIHLLKCGHCFHGNCIQAWIVNEKTCPNCRSPIL